MEERSNSPFIFLCPKSLMLLVINYLTNSYPPFRIWQADRSMSGGRGLAKSRQSQSSGYQSVVSQSPPFMLSVCVCVCVKVAMLLFISVSTAEVVWFNASSIWHACRSNTAVAFVAAAAHGVVCLSVLSDGVQVDSVFVCLEIFLCSWIPSLILNWMSVRQNTVNK